MNESGCEAQPARARGLGRGREGGRSPHAEREEGSHGEHNPTNGEALGQRRLTYLFAILINLTVADLVTLSSLPAAVRFFLMWTLNVDMGLVSIIWVSARERSVMMGRWEPGRLGSVGEVG